MIKEVNINNDLDTYYIPRIMCYISTVILKTYKLESVGGENESKI